MAQKICKFCGLPFEGKGTSAYCDRQHFDTCIVCGKQFPVSKSVLGAKDRRHTCSKKCSVQLRKQTNTAKYGSYDAYLQHVSSKIKETNIERYGVENPQVLPEIQQKIKETCLERYGTERFIQSEQGKELWDQIRNTDEYKKKQRESYEKTMREQYGENWGKVCIDKMKRSYEAATGYEHPSQDPKVQAKVNATNQARYGVDRPLQNSDIRENSTEIWKSQYGVGGDKHDDLLEKRRASLFEHFGVHEMFEKGAVRTKIEEEYKARTGYDYPTQNPEVIAKMRESCQGRYGEYHPMKSPEMISRYILNPDKIEVWTAFKEDPKAYLSNRPDKPTLFKLSEELGVHPTTIGYLIHDNQLEDYITYGPNKHTIPEQEVIEELYKIDPSLVIVQNDRKLIYPYEIDVVLPDYDIGIEVDPTATHNHTLNVYDGGKGLPITYHQMKSNMCQTNGMFLYHIFGYDWSHNKDVVVSMLKNLLHKNDIIVYARKCDVREVSSKDAVEFLNSNHRQKFAAAPIRLGLYHNDELVSLMTFGKMRHTIGTGNEDLSDCYELVRFCNKTNTSVVGGASRLFKHFVDTYHPNRIRSFSDIAHTRGKLYETLGFKDIRHSDPNYVWVDWNTDRAYHRTNAQKQNICQFLHDDTIDLSKSESEIMIEHGFVQFYDCGTILWEWHK